MTSRNSLLATRAISKWKAKSTPEYDSERETRVLLEQMNKSIGLIAEQHGTIKEDITVVKRKVSNIELELDTVKMAVRENSRQVKENAELIEGNSFKIDRIEKKLDTTIENHERRIIKIEEKVGI